jgi:hypothetical protein
LKVSTITYQEKHIGYSSKELIAKMAGPFITNRLQRLRDQPNVLTLYHATGAEAANNILSSGKFYAGIRGHIGPGIYFSETEDEARFRSQGEKSTVLKCQVKLGNMKTVHAESSGSENDDSQLLSDGYDSVVYVRKGRWIYKVGSNEYDQITNAARVGDIGRVPTPLSRPTHHARGTVSSASDERQNVESETTVYRIIGEHGAQLSSGLSIQTKLDCRLARGTIVNVVEDIYSLAQSRHRGRLQDGRWITISIFEEDGSIAELIPTGTYRINAAPAQLSTGPSIATKNSNHLAYKTPVNVVELRYVASENRIRGRLDDGQWITVRNEREISDLALQIPLGVYRITTPHAQLSTGPSITTKIPTRMQKGTLVNVSALQYVSAENRIRGQLDNGKWITTEILDDSESLAVLDACRGDFQIVADTMLSTGPSVATKIPQHLYRGAAVKVVEVRYVPSERRIRGKLDDGKWITIRCENSGSVFAERIV